MNEGSIDWRWAQGCRCLGHTLHHAQDGRPLWGGTGWWVGGEDRPGGREGREFLPPPPGTESYLFLYLFLLLKSCFSARGI